MISATLEAPSPGLPSSQTLRRPASGPDGELERTIRSVHDAVALVYRIDRDLLRHPTRGRSEVAFARQVAMYLAHVTLGLTLTTVGRAFGRDRTTVSHACALVEDARDNPEFDRTIELIASIAKHLGAIDGTAGRGVPAE